MLSGSTPDGRAGGRLEVVFASPGVCRSVFV